MKRIYKNLYQHTVLNEDYNISSHCYLLDSSRPLLVQTGGYVHVKELISELKEVLGDRELAYIFVSHLGADECGGISEILFNYPNAEIICSERMQRQFPEFGVDAVTIAVKGGDVMRGDDYDFYIVDYPSEPHLRSGILLFERTNGIFFSSDLMRRAGGRNGEITDSVWRDEVAATGNRQIPNKTMLRGLHHELNKLSPTFVAVGHGVCLMLHE